MKTWRCQMRKQRRPRVRLERHPLDEGWWRCRDHGRCIMRGAARGRAGVRQLLGEYDLNRRRDWRRILAEHKRTAQHGKPEWFWRSI